jgi:hypothetical protein
MSKIMQLLLLSEFQNVEMADELILKFEMMATLQVETDVTVHVWPSRLVTIELEVTLQTLIFEIPDQLVMKSTPTAQDANLYETMDSEHLKKTEMTVIQRVQMVVLQLVLLNQNIQELEEVFLVLIFEKNVLLGMNQMNLVESE